MLRSQRGGVVLRTHHVACLEFSIPELLLGDCGKAKRGDRQNCKMLMRPFQRQN